ncbi:MAG TPA: thioester domain-containing protein [Acidimicrobiales bacterium]|nr:thioester domain-containing protein [Acidimicrobiales bacterium]
MIAAIAAAAGLIAGTAAPAAAATATFGGAIPGESGSIRGSIDGGAEASFGGGLFAISIDGEVDAKAYCIDIATGISGNPTYEDADWNTSDIANLETVEAILANYYPNGNGPEGFTLTGSDSEKARGTQAAIWHFTDGFEPSTDPDDNPPNVIANYEAILAAVVDGIEGFGEPTVALSITPPDSTEGVEGGLVGPYVVDTTAASVTVTPSEGVSLVDSDGEPFVGEVVDGTELYLTSGAVGTGTISATASATAMAGQVFVAQGQQTLILANSTDVEASAEASVSFVTAPPTSSTTESTTTTTEATTTTTVPITVQSTVPDAPTTTVPVTPNQGEGGGLPVTGAQSLMLVGVAAVLLAIGAGFGIVSRRKRLAGEE